MKTIIADFDATATEWNACLAGNSTATVFHTSAWLKLMMDFYRFKLYSLAAYDNERLTGILPVFHVKKLWLNHLVSLPLRDKGGCVVRDNDSAARQALVDQACSLTRELNCRYLEMKTFCVEEKQVMLDTGFTVSAEWVLTGISLDRDFSVTRSRFNDKRLNWSINKALASELEFESLTGPEAVNEFYRLFLINRKKLGVPPYSLNYFVQLFRLMAPLGLARIFVVRRQGQPQAAMFALMYDNRAYDVYSASLESGHEFRANDYLMWNVIKWLGENGFTWLDLGADSPHQESLIQYKLKWGATKENQYYMTYSPSGFIPVTRDSDDPRYRLLRSFWRHTPDLIFEHLGSKLIQYLA